MDELAGSADPASSGELAELVNLEILRELAQAHETIGELRALEVRAGGDRAELELELERERELRQERELTAQRAILELEELRGRGLLARLLNR